MQLPSDILKNTEAALALLSGALGLLGLLLCLAGLGASFLFIQGAQQAVLPQIDSAISSVSDVQQTINYAASGAESGKVAVGNLSGAFAAYADSSNGLSDTLAGISAIPVIGADPKISDAAMKMRVASAQFAGAAQSLNATSAAVGSAASSLRKTSDGLSGAKQTLADAKNALGAAFGALYLVAIAGALCMAALFGSVCLLSVSVLLSHYPRFFDSKEGEGKKAGEKKA